MAEPLRILILEDNPHDAELIQFELQEAGFAFTANVVITERDFVRGLQEFAPDLILSDYDLPKYNGAQALAESMKRCPDTPFILVTGAVGEDRAIEILTQGAKDYVLKSRLQQRLAPAVRRALAEAEEHRARNRAEHELREAHKTLEERVELRTAELTAEIAMRKTMEKTLRESEKRYRLLTENIKDVVWIMDAETMCFRYVSPSVERLRGYTTEEILAEPATRALTEESSAYVINLTSRRSADMLSGKEPPGRFYTDEVEQPCKDGSTVWTEVITSYYINPENGRVEVLGVTRDLTERKRSEQEMTILADIGRAIGSTLEINEVYERVADEIRKLIPFDSLVVNLSNAEQETLDIAYVSGMDIPGRRVGDSFPVRGTIGEGVIGTRRGVIIQSDNPEDLVDKCPSLIVSVRAGMHSVMSVPLISRDEVIGTLIMRSIKPVAYTEQDLRLAEKIGMQIAGALANAQLFHNLSKTEKSLRESEERLRGVVNNTQAGYFFIDVAGRFQRVNAAWLRMHGYASADLVIGRHFSLTQPAADMAVAEQHIRNLLAGDSISSAEGSRLRKDGSVGYHTFSAHPVIQRGEIIGLEGFIIDITERKQAEEEKRSLEERLQRAEKMEALGQLAGGVAHDLNNVLGVSTIYSELLQEKIPEDSPLRKYVDNILSSTQKGAAIIEDLLTLARRGVAVSDVMNLNGIISNFLKTPMFEKMRASHPNVTIRMECQEELLNIKGSPLHLETTLMNLVSNAVEAISGKGEVTIRTENRYLDKPIRGYDDVKEGDYAVLTITDTGMGIPAENIEKIFEPFYTKKTMGRSGTGLGLAIVWGTVKDHHGYIDLHTEVGEGTAFTLYFPVTREELGEQEQKIPRERYLGEGESVLVVDDIAEQRDIATRLLTRLGYRVQAVASGEEAVEYLKEHPADILVLDMIMSPGIDGLETFERVLKINPKQKAIIVSGFAETERVKKAQELGAGAYVRKPYLMERIGVAIRDELTR